MQHIWVWRKPSQTRKHPCRAAHSPCSAHPVRLCQDVVMAAKKFVVQFKGGDIQTVYAEKGDQDDNEDGYVFFRDSNGEITYLFEKLVVAEWREED
jgi:hypothetical protein